MPVRLSGGLPSAASFAAVSASSLPMMPVWLGIHPIWTTEPERSRADVALQMLWRKGAW